MTPSDAAKILDLPADSAPDQIEVRFQELRGRLEDRIAKAPTPGLKAKYRESLDEITQAFEALTLAADASNLPSLRRAAPAAPPPPVQPVAPAPAPAASKPSPELTARTVVLLHLAGFVKFGLITFFLCFGLGMLAVLALNSADDTIKSVVVIACLLAGMGAGVLFWRRSVRRARRRLAEGRKNTLDNVLGVLGTALVLLAVANMVFVIPVLNRQHDEASAASLLQEIAERGAKADQQVAAAERTEQEAIKFLSDLEAREQAQIAGSADPAKRRSTRALIRAQAAYVHWFNEALPLQPAKRARLKLDNARDRLVAEQGADVSLPTARQALQDYEQLATSIGFTIARQKPDPQYVENFDLWQEEAGRGTGWAMYNLYLTYQSRHGPVEPDLAVALDWLRRAAATNNAGAMYALAERLWSGQDLTANQTEAGEWYRKAAEAGHPTAMAVVGEHCLAGDGVPQDAAKGAEWLRKAAMAGDARGMYGFGRCLAQGNGVGHDEKTAIEWWIKATRLDWYAAREELIKRKITW